MDKIKVHNPNKLPTIPYSKLEDFQMKLYKNKEWLKKQYLENELSANKISEICKTGYQTIYNWLKKYKIPIRSESEATHLAKSNHCELSKEAKQWIDGELMGDGCLYLRSTYSANFKYGSKYFEYIQYVSDTLNSFGIKQAGKINKRHHKNFNCYSYEYASLSYVELLSIYKRWYSKPGRKKKIPKDLKLTPLILRQEYIGDGSLHKQSRKNGRKNGRPSIILATCGFLESDIKLLMMKLNKLDFITYYGKKRNLIKLSAKSTEAFLNYIGKCPVKCYQYKWEY